MSPYWMVLILHLMNFSLHGIKPLLSTKPDFFYLPCTESSLLNLHAMQQKGWVYKGLAVDWLGTLLMVSSGRLCADITPCNGCLFAVSREHNTNGPQVFGPRPTMIVHSVVIAGKNGNAIGLKATAEAMGRWNWNKCRLECPWAALATLVSKAICFSKCAVGMAHGEGE